MSVFELARVMGTSVRMIERLWRAARWGPGRDRRSFGRLRRQARSGRELYEQTAAEAEADTLGWLAAAGFGYQELRAENAKKVERMSWLSGFLGVLMVAQTLAWLAALAIH